MQGSPPRKAASAALLLTILFGVCGQLLMKYAALRSNAGAAIVQIAPILGAAISVYSVGIISWIVALRGLPLAIAYPVTGLSYVGILWGSAYWFGEGLSALRLLGAGLIIIGVVLVVFRATGEIRPSAIARSTIRTP